MSTGGAGSFGSAGGPGAGRRTPAGHDRGMKAVARVREVRERDSRAGLLQAMANVRQREAQLAELTGALTVAADRVPATLADLVVSRHYLDAMARAVRDAEKRLDASHVVATEAHVRWQADKSRVRAVEHLLEQRALRYHDALDRAEVREVDDIVGQRRHRSQQTQTQTQQPTQDRTGQQNQQPGGPA